MRLINFGVGETADRLTILALKILAGEEAGRDVKHFRDERNVLLTKMNARGGASFLEELIELSAVNATIWHGEDQLRAYFKTVTPPEVVAQLAFRIQRLNDRRAELIDAINKDVGDHRGEEKL